MRKIDKPDLNERLAFKVASTYAVFSGLWILFSDQILLTLVKDPGAMTKIQMVKGWVFIFASALIIFYLLQGKIKNYLKTAAALQESEERFRAIFNQRFQLTGLLDVQGRLLMINETACKMVRVEAKELTGKYFWEIPHWSHSKEIQLEIQQAVQTVKQNEKAISFETTHVDFRGDIKYIEFSMTPVHDRNGAMAFIVPEGKDITEKKESENRLVQSERNYREIYNSSSDAILIHDSSTGKIVDVNQTMLDMFGYTYQEAMQLEIGNIGSGAPEFSQEEAYKKVRKAVKDGPQLFEWLARHKNGICFWVEVALQKTQISGQGRVLAVVRNISKRKQLDSELQLVKHSIERSAYPFYWIQEDARFFNVNNAACNSLGYSHKELCSMRVSDIDPEFPESAWPDFWQKLKSEKTLTFESRHRKKNGEIFPIEITTNLFEFEEQEHLFAYVKDIGEKVKYKKEQENLEKQLQQAQKMEAIGTLAGGIAHDFNNILSAIIGFSEVALEDTPQKSPVYSYIQEVFNAGHRAGKLVDQILIFSRNQDRELKPLKIHIVIKEALKLMRSSIPATIEIKRYIDPNCGLVLADPTQMQQIIMNLCTNAYHAMKPKGGILSVNLRPINRSAEDNLSDDIFLKPGPYLELEVSDTGHGISQKNLERVFEPYFTTKKKGEGTGLGLAIVHSIINDFKGYLDVKSRVGEGTTFLVHLPVIKDTVQGKKEHREVASLPTGEEKILFIDDEKAVVDFSKIMLKSLGYKVIGHTDSRQAIEAFKISADSFDLIITDMTMPHLTGEKLIRQALAIKPDIPVILCTGYSDFFNPEQAKAIGVHEYIEKPVLKKDLAHKIRDVLDKKD